MNEVLGSSWDRMYVFTHAPGEHDFDQTLGFHWDDAPQPFNEWNATNRTEQLVVITKGRSVTATAQLDAAALNLQCLVGAPVRRAAAVLDVATTRVFSRAGTPMLLPGEGAPPGALDVCRNTFGASPR